MIFDLFNRKPKNSVTVKQEPEIKLPFDYMIVPGEKAVETCLRIREDASKSVTPVIMGGKDKMNLLLDNLDADKRSPEAVIAESEGFMIDEFIQSRTSEDPEFYQEVRGKWPLVPVQPGYLTAHTDVLSGKPLKEVCLGLVPTNSSYEVPAYLKYGGWNECPSAEEHVGILRYWHDKYGAEIIAITGDVIECTVTNPPRTKEEALALAHEQFIYCTDIVTQGVETIDALAATLLNSNYWYFWWD
jgi:hypothetical protein